MLPSEGKLRAPDVWHSDVTWRPEPSMGSILRIVESPPLGGDTLWADMGAAYDLLDDDTKEQIDGLVALHDYVRVFGAASPGRQAGEDAREAPDRRAPGRADASRDGPQDDLREPRVHVRHQGHGRRRRAAAAAAGSSVTADDPRRAVPVPLAARAASRSGTTARRSTA